MSVEQPTPEEQERLSRQMKAERNEPDPQVAADFKARYDELQATLTDERAKRERAERDRDAAEARALALHPQSVGVGRQIPILFTLRDEHVNAADEDDELDLIVADVNAANKNVKGFKSLTVGDFLALNAELLDNEARARGFLRGARHAFTADNGDTVGGYHLFAGTQVVVGVRDASSR